MEMNKTTNHYADLALYFGMCPSDGFGEGSFNLKVVDELDEWSKQIHYYAMGNVMQYLLPESKWGLTIHRGGLAPSEDDALRLIQHAEAVIPGSHGLIELVDSIHGRTRFERKIRFPGAVDSQRGELVEKMRQSGFVPKPTGSDELFTINMLSALYKGEALEQRLREYGFGPDHSWHKALKFF